MKFELVPYWKKLYLHASIWMQGLTGFVTAFVLSQSAIDPALQSLFGVSTGDMLRRIAGEKWFAYFVLASVFLTMVAKAIKQPGVTETEIDPKDGQ